MATLPEKIELQVVTPTKHIFSEDVQSIELPGKDGYLGILPGHAPLLTELGAGILTFNKGGETRSMTVIDGFAEVLPNRVIVLADESEKVEDIDAGEARADLEKAQHELPQAGASEEDWKRANAAIARATVRVEASEKTGTGARH
jgi:F-type H+-transporting ATPase subunit epsilon